MPCDSFWDEPFRDNTDLTVIVAGDICEQRIDIRDYLKYLPDLNKVTIIRQCLLLGADIEKLDTMTMQQLLGLREVRLHEIFNFYEMGNTSRRNYLLQVIQQPFARWGPGCLCIETYTTNLMGKTDIVEIANIVRSALKFKYFTSSSDCMQPIFSIRQPDED